MNPVKYLVTCLLFSVSALALADAPPATSLIAPEGNVSDNTPTYSWNAVSDSTHYYLWVNDSTGNVIKKWYTATQVGCQSGSGACAVTSATTLAEGSGIWWVQTWNSGGHGAWSSSKSFVVSTQPPAKTDLVSPVDNISDNTPSYNWNAVSSSTWYYLWVNDSTGNVIKKWVTAAQAGCQSGSGVCSITPATTLADGNGIWWVQTWNSNGYGAWSSSKAFNVNGYFLAPDINASGTIINGVDIANGKLNRSENDLTSSTLSLSRIYNGGGWSHQYASKLWVNGLDYSDWSGAKSDKYATKALACTSGWNALKATLYNGKLSSAQASYADGYCNISVSGESKAKFAIHRSAEAVNTSVTLTRPDGTSMTFAKEDSTWKPLSGAPYSLTKSATDWLLKTPSDSVEKYNSTGSLKDVTNSNQQTTSLSYNGSGLLSSVVGPFGKTLSFSYNGTKVSSIIGAQGTVSYAYSNNRISTVTKVDGSTTKYQYSNGKLSAVIDALNQTVASYSYDNNSRVSIFEGQNGTGKTTYTYTASATQVKNIANNATDSYEFDVVKGAMKGVKTTDVDGDMTTQSYDANGYPLLSVAVNGTKTSTTYNSRGLLELRVNAVGLISEKQSITHWHSSFRKPILKVEDGIQVGNKATKFFYNSQGLLIKRVEGIIENIEGVLLSNKRTSLYEYNNKGQITKTTAPNGAETLTSYDSNGNRTGSSNALGQENKTLSFDATGKPLVSEDANGIQTTNTYDSAGRLVSTSSNGRTTSYEYDLAGRQTKTTYADGSTSESEYDASGNLTKTIDQDGNVTESSFDSNGNQTSSQVKDDQGNVILSSSSEYNNENQLITSTDAQGNDTTYDYDSSGNQTKVIDAKGNETCNVYDANNRLKKSTDALGGETTYAYDVDGNRTRVTAANGTTTFFNYDNFNQLIKEISTDRGTTTYQYDGSGNQIGITDAEGNIKNIGYDVLNRKTGESWTGAPDLTITYAYDSCSNGVGKLCSITDKSGSTSFTYDAKGQVTQKTQNIDGVNLTKTYAYNNQGKLTGETYPSGAQISYGYNVDKVSSISINGNPYMSDISYNAANQLTGWKWADGTTYVKAYDANGRLSTFSLGDEVRTLYYDNNGNITGFEDSDNQQRYDEFTYDALNRLNNFERSINDITTLNQQLEYDANGNRTYMVDGVDESYYTIHQSSNRLTQLNDTSYSYDLNGNITYDGNHSYSYDARNRLTGVDGTSSYLFNANNMRVKKTTPQGITLYGWDNDRIYAEYDENGNAIQETVYFGSTPVALLKDGNIYRIFADQIDTPRVITDNWNNKLWAWDSKPFGETAPNEDVDGDGTNLSYNLRFPGQYYDAETDKHYNFNRDYDPRTGRYIQFDPIGLDGGVNSFGYVGNSPLVGFDARGEKFGLGGLLKKVVVKAWNKLFGKVKPSLKDALRLYNKNDIHHLFGRGGEAVGKLLNKFGTPDAALREVQKVAQALVNTGYKTGAWAHINVGGIPVSISGKVIDGIFRIASIAKKPF